MSPTDKTLRLHNVDPRRSQLSLSLLRVHPKTAPRLRRGVHLTPIVIPASSYYDVCKKLDVSFEEAQVLVDHSPDVQAHKNAGRLLVREFPPPVELQAADAARGAQAEDARVKTAALNPPDSPNAVPPGVNLEEAGLPEDTPRATRPIPSKPAELEGPPTEDIPTMDESASLTPAAVAGPASMGEPSADWALSELQAYARGRGLDTSGSKTILLRRIRKALSES